MGFVLFNIQLFVCVVYGRSLFVLLSFISYGHCVVCPLIYGLWLPFMVIVLSVLLQLTASDYPSWSLCCLSFFNLRLLITLHGHCVVCPSSIYGFWLPFMVIVLSVLLQFTISDYPSWSLCCLSFFNLRSLITLPGHCVVCPSSIYDLWLSFMVIVLSVLLQFTISDYPSWSLCCLSFFNLRSLIILHGHCVVCPSSIYDLWLSFMVIVLSVLLQFTISDYPSWSLCCLSFFNLRSLIILLVIVLSVLLQFTISDYPSWSLCCLSFFNLRSLITLPGHCVVCPSSIYDLWLSFMVIVLSVLLQFTISDYPSWSLCCLSFFNLRSLIILHGHCVVCPSSIYDLWLPFLVIVLSVLLQFTISDYPSWSLCCLSFFNLRSLITLPGHCVVCPSSIYDLWLSFMVIVLSVLLQFTISDYPSWSLCCLSFFNLRSLIILHGHCVVCPSSIYDLWLSFMVIVLSVLLQFTISDYPSWSLCCLSFFNLRSLIILHGHCVVCPSSIYDLWLSFIVLSVLLQFTISDYPSWSLCCLSFFNLRSLIILHGHCVVCPSSIYDLWLSFMVIVLSVLLQFTISDYPSWSLCCLSFFNLRSLIILHGHCVVCPSSIYDLWLPFLVIVLSVLLQFTISDYPSWSLCCLSFFNLRSLIILHGHCVVCPSSIYDLWLSFLVIVLSVLLQFTISDYPSWSLCCLSFFNLRSLIILHGHCVVCPSSIYDLWLPFLVIVLSILLQFTISDYPSWSLCCLSFFNLRSLITLPGHCVVCPSSIYDLWLSFMVIVLSVLLQFTISDYPSWSLCCLSFFNLRSLIILHGHCVVCPSSIYDLWLPFLVIVLSVLLQFTISDYPSWSLCCLSFFNLRSLITLPGHCVVCPSSIYDLWLSFMVIVLSVLLQFTISDYPSWSLCCLSFFNLRSLIILHGHCVVCPSSIYDLWLPFLVIVLSVLLQFTISDYPSWSLCCLSFFNLRSLIILQAFCAQHLVVCVVFIHHCLTFCPLSVGHYFVYPSIYGFLLSLKNFSYPFSVV